MNASGRPAASTEHWRAGVGEQQAARQAGQARKFAPASWPMAPARLHAALVTSTLRQSI
jgi:hypothetical protein